MSEDLVPSEQSAANRPPDLPIGLCLGFGVGTVGVSVLLNAVTIYFPAMMTSVLGQSAALAGLLLTVSKLYDIGADLAIGTISDRTRTRWGRRRPFLLAGAIVSGLCFPLIFAPPDLDGGMIALYFGAVLIVYSTGYSLFNVPYLAMPAEMTDDYHQRTRLMSFRTFFISIGQTIAGAGTAALLLRLGRDRDGYAQAGLVLSAIIVLAMTIAFLSTGSARRLEPEVAPRPPWRVQARMILDNRPILVLLATKFLHLLSFASVATTTLLFFVNVTKDGYAGQETLSLASNAAIAASMPIWAMIAHRITKHRAFMVATGLYVCATLTWLLAAAGDPVWIIAARGAVLGFASGGMLLMGTAMLPDTMAYDRARTGLRREGLFSGFYATVEKVAFAIGPAVIGIYLSASGFIPTRGGKAVEQPDSAIAALYGGIAIVPAVLMALSIVVLSFYDLDEARLKQSGRMEGQNGA